MSNHKDQEKKDQKDMIGIFPVRTCTYDENYESISKPNQKNADIIRKGLWKFFIEWNKCPVFKSHQTHVPDLYKEEIIAFYNANDAANKCIQEQLEICSQFELCKEMRESNKTKNQYSYICVQENKTYDVFYHEYRFKNEKATTITVYNFPREANFRLRGEYIKKIFESYVTLPIQLVIDVDNDYDGLF
jgi:hypothetical protein